MLLQDRWFVGMKRNPVWAHHCDVAKMTSLEALREGPSDVFPAIDKRGTGRPLQLAWQILTMGIGAHR